jgi:prepilin signal peptidase PulO-like enzyme (type II secretory pathway)
MILSEEIVRKFDKEFREEIGTIYPDGLSADQVELIKKVYKTKGLETIEVYHTFPFAIWMLLGVVLTLLFKQDVLHLFLSVSKISL